MYIDLKKLVNKIVNNGVNIQIENRNLPGWNDYDFPKQHVEILNFHNKADNDLWDGLILGYNNSSFDYETIYRTKSIIGIILIEDGNHKLIFKIPYKRGFNKNLFKKEIKKFINNYRKKWGLKTKFLNLNKLMLYLNY